MTIKSTYYEKLAETVMKGLRNRHMNAYYCPTAADALTQAMELIPSGATVSFGGSVTLNETHILNQLRSRDDITLFDRDTAKSPEETDAIFHEALGADYYLMSSNAITKDGELINIDGNGNRVAALIYGPKNVIVVAGMNKIVSNVEEGISRSHNVAASQNCLRLKKSTPCSVTGSCANCLANTICSNVVITRTSKTPSRIKVLLIGEDLGF